ncbi:MAG: family transcriptional regulator [Frankiales bacterium]|nr:family transcriptional regulator [Frankiales bacterium]
MDLGALLRQARHEAGLTQEVVARAAGITRHALSRWESGARPVRSDDADRILAACGRDARFQLVTRHADLDDILDRLATMPVLERLWQVGGLVVPSELHQLQATGAVVFTGAWASAALGLPPLRGIGGFLIRDDAAEQARVAAVLNPLHPVSLAPGGPWSVTWNDTVFDRHPTARWQANLLGEFTSEVTSAAVPELRLATDEVPWRVIEPSQLVPDDVDQLALDRWLARAATRAANGYLRRRDRRRSASG